MDFAHEQVGDVTVVKLAGRFDAAAARAAEASFRPLLDAAEPRIAIDMSKLDYISSAGLRVLLIVAKKVQQTKGKVALFEPPPNVREVLAVSGFDGILSVQPTSAAALAAVR